MNPEQSKKLKNEELSILREIDRICEEQKLDYFLIGGTLLGAVRHKGMIPWDDDIDIAMPRKDYDYFMKHGKKLLSKRFNLVSHETNYRYFKAFAKVEIKGTLFKEPCITKDSNWGIWVDIFPLDTISGNKIKKAPIIKKRIKHLNSILEKKYAYYFRDCKTIRNKAVYLLSKISSTKHVVKQREKYMRLFNGSYDNNDYFINYGSRYSVEKQTHRKSAYYPAKKISFEGELFSAPNNPDYILTKIYGKNYMELPPAEKRVTHDPLYVRFSDGDVFESR